MGLYYLEVCGLRGDADDADSFGGGLEVGLEGVAVVEDWWLRFWCWDGEEVRCAAGFS